jgi:hypothetical protein
VSTQSATDATARTTSTGESRTVTV